MIINIILSCSLVFKLQYFIFLLNNEVNFPKTRNNQRQRLFVELQLQIISHQL